MVHGRAVLRDEFRGICLTQVRAMSIMAGHELGKVLCKAFGISPDNVRRVTLDASASDAAVVVVVERFVTLSCGKEKEQAIELIRERYDVVQRDEAVRDGDGWAVVEQDTAGCAEDA